MDRENDAPRSSEADSIDGSRVPGQAMSVSCVSSTFCMVVGFSGNDAAPFDDLWNGSTWQSEPVAVPPGAGDFALDAVDCLSPTDCQAVGHVEGGPLNERWDGTSWSVLPTLAQGLGWLNGVSCGDSNDCMAIGNDTTGALASAHWNGSEWSRVDIPNEATGTGGERLTSVSCPSASSCVVVGWNSFQVTPTTGGEAPIVDSWDGSSSSRDPSDQSGRRPPRHVERRGLLQRRELHCGRRPGSGH